MTRPEAPAPMTATLRTISKAVLWSGFKTRRRTGGGTWGWLLEVGCGARSLSPWGGLRWSRVFYMRQPSDIRYSTRRSKGVFSELISSELCEFQGVLVVPPMLVAVGCGNVNMYSMHEKLEGASHPKSLRFRSIRQLQMVIDRVKAYIDSVAP